MTNKLIALIKIIFLLTLGYASASFAQVNDGEYFIDHSPVAPGEIISVDYTIPSRQHVIECHQDMDASNLGSVEWKYKETSFKGQIGNFHSLTLMRDDTTYPEVQMARGQTADTSGKLVIKNLDTTELFVTCSYDLVNQNIKR